MSTGDYLNDIPDNDTPFPSKTSETECICARHTSDPLLIHVHDKCPMHGTESNGMNKTKISDDSTNLTQEDFSTWGFYCDSCKVFFDIQIDGAVHSSVDGISYSHKCGSGARYISYDRRAVSETKMLREQLSVAQEQCQRSAMQGEQLRHTVQELREEIEQETTMITSLKGIGMELQQANASLRAQLAEATKPVTDREMSDAAIHYIPLGPFGGEPVSTPVLTKSRVDKLIAARCIKNLGTWQKDKQMIAECTENERKDLENGHCPDCKHREFLAGPSAGMCQNIKCAQCDAKFNVGPLSVQRLLD